MDILIDGVKLDTAFEETDTMETIISEVEDYIKKINKVVEEIYVDGEKMSEEKLSYDEVTTIEFITKTPRILILESLQEMNVYLDKLNNGISEMVELMIGGQESKGMQILVDGIQGMQWIYDVFVAIDNVSEIKNEEMGFNDILESYGRSLESILEALKNRDVVLLSDILEYELQENINEIKEMLPEMYDYILEEEKQRMKV